MTDSRERRITALTEAAKAKSKNKTRDADQAIRRLIKRGEPITFKPCNVKLASPTPSSTTTPNCANESSIYAAPAARPPPTSLLMPTTPSSSH